MPSILDTLSAHLDDKALQQISGRIGADQGATSKAIAAAVPLLLGALARNASQGDGAQRLHDAKAGSLLATLAPLVLGAVGRVRQDRGLDANGLAGLLGGERDALTASAPGMMGIVSRLLDRNQDGSVLDDVGGMLGSLFGKR